MDPIRGQVALILGPRELVINKGTSDGVWPGMKFAVLDLRATHIKDPQTNVDLGSIRIEKVRVEVTRAEPRASLASTYELASEGYASLSNIQQLLTLGAPARYETFKGESAGWDEKQSIVHRGDVVEQIFVADHRVVEMIDVYPSPKLEGSNTRAVVLQPVTSGPRASYPTTKEYQSGRLVTWEWDTAKIYGPMWYLNQKGQAVKAWDRSAQFIGEEVIPDSDS